MSVLGFKAKAVPLLFRNYKVGNFTIKGLLEEGKNHENKVTPSGIQLGTSAIQSDALLSELT